MSDHFYEAYVQLRENLKPHRVTKFPQRIIIPDVVFGQEIVQALLRGLNVTKVEAQHLSSLLLNARCLHRITSSEGKNTVESALMRSSREFRPDSRSMYRLSAGVPSRVCRMEFRHLEIVHFRR